MKKETSLIIAAIILALGLIFLFTYQRAPNAPKIVLHSYQMVSGTIKAVQKDSNSIIVVGSARSFDPKYALDIRKTIMFLVTPQTVLKKNIIGATLEQMKSGKPFHPMTTVASGTFSDFAVGIGVFTITTNDDLFAKTTATAKEVDYIIHDFPNPFNR